MGLNGEPPAMLITENTLLKVNTSLLQAEQAMQDSTPQECHHYTTKPRKTEVLGGRELK